MKIVCSFAALLMLQASVLAIEPMSSGKLELELQKLDTLTSVLYVAAHPDDENTRLIAYFANEAKAFTTYLALTRGDGGQNLIGADLGEKLGLVRTQELLAARRIDGGKQRFTRANDFGYSKTPEETLRIWGEQEILSDLVWAIRSTRPDVIITRFSTEAGTTHGHHTASARLAVEAFTAAADPERFPEQLAFVDAWSATRLIWNTSPWFYRRRNIEFDPTNLLSVDTGVYNPLLGAAYSEIAAHSRTSHKTQGFGSTPGLGVAMEYFEHLAGEPTTDDVFAGVDTSWSRVPDSAPVATAIARAIDAYSPQAPADSVPSLIEAHRALSALPAQVWKTRKLEDIERVIAACLGLDLESISEHPSAVPGGDVTVELNAIQRSARDVRIALSLPTAEATAGEPTRLPPNELIQISRTVSLPGAVETSQPYWLQVPYEIGRYQVADAQQIGAPENRPTLPVDVLVAVDGYTLGYSLATTYNYNDPVRGEVKEPFVLTPPAMVNLPGSPLIFSSTQPETIVARVIARSDIVNGQLRFGVENGWKVEPATITFDAASGQELSFETTLTPPDEANQAVLNAELIIDGKAYSRGFERIEYDHIPAQTLFPSAQIRVVLLDVKKEGDRIGYIPGAGDAIPEALERIGYAVETLAESDMNSETLAEYDAVVLGIRALNTNLRIGYYMPALFEYASEGGVVILQYNTNRSLKTDSFSPYALTLSRERATDETAAMRVLSPEHPVLNVPNVISSADFDGWVQERGLYFASEWDPAFTPILSVNDRDEDPSEGSLLVARHGDGWFVYSGLSWFRQLPAGVPGAYRIFANLVSLGHTE